MELIFYSNKTGKQENCLQEMVEEQVLSEERFIYRSIRELMRKLKKPHAWHTIAVLLASDRDDLFHLADLYDLFGDIRIILIVPDHETETVSTAHRLRPRLLAYKENNFDMIIAVLKHMIHEHPGSGGRFF